MEKSKNQTQHNQSLDSKQIFLLLFARELIRNSEEGLLQLKRILEKERAESVPVKPVLLPEAKMPEPETRPVNREANMYPLIKSILSQAPRMALDGELSAVKPVHIEPARREIMNGHQREFIPVLRIPEPRLPPEFQHLKPTSTTREIDLSKLNVLVNDPGVKRIECDGPSKYIVVSGSMGRKPTEIALSNDEIDEVVEKFSKAAKIPIDIGVFRVVVGNLILSAIISDIVPTRFVINKIIPAQQTSFRPAPQAPYPTRMSYADYIHPVNIPNRPM